MLRAPEPATVPLLLLVLVWAMKAPDGFAAVITAGSNSALGNITWRLQCAIAKMGLDFDPELIVRFARSTALKDKRVLPCTPDGVFEKKTGRPADSSCKEDMACLAQLRRRLVQGGKIIIATLEKVPEAMNMPNALRPCLMVQEESSQCTEGLSIVAFLSGVGSGARLVLAGDHRQLPPCCH